MMYNRYVPDAAGVYRQTTVETVPDVPDVAEKYFQQAMKNRRSAEYEDIIRITDYCNRFSYCK